MSFNESWSYSNASNWKQAYPAAKGQQQSPINIETTTTSDCSLLCQIAMKYSTSKCYARVINKTPVITFDSGSFIKFTKTREILALKSMTIHTPSLHTINGVQYDMEVVLYHKLTGSITPGDPNYMPGGTAISIMFQRGADYGRQNNFFNAFINQLPIEKGENEIDVPVGDSWGPELILPELKTYYFYPGSLPFPPCEENWKWIVFEEIQGISPAIIDTLSLPFKDNVRPTQRLNGRIPSYNSSVEMKTDNELEQRAAKEKELLAKAAQPTGGINPEQTTPPLTLSMQGDAWYVANKPWLKGAFIAIVLLLIIYGSMKMVKYIINEDILNKIMVRQALGKARTEKMSANASKNAAMANVVSPSQQQQASTNAQPIPSRNNSVQQ